ncbi:MAG: hypothetical protein RMJ83_08960 [Armatimonadota bacterium]|nr:hypothetical protein [Armatimonadota bacterium]
MNLPTITFTQSSTPIPTGEYAVKCLSVELVDNKFEPSKQQLKWTFEIVAAGDFQGRKLVGYTSVSTSLKSKAAAWAGALLGRPLADGETLDWGKVIEAHARAVVVCRAKPDGSEYARLEDLKPLKSTPPAPKSDDSAGDPFAQ